MWSHTYKGCYIQGHFDRDACQAIESPSGFGHTWAAQCKSLHAAKIAITRHLKDGKP